MIGQTSMPTSALPNPTVKASFAQVAASASAAQLKQRPVSNRDGHAKVSERLPDKESSLTSDLNEPASSTRTGDSNGDSNPTNADWKHEIKDLSEDLKAVQVDESTDHPASRGAQDSDRPSGPVRVDSTFDDAQTHVSTSDTSGKPASLDGKSVASGATFALDEKESLRPDDSASLKAAEDDESFNGPFSTNASSRFGSEAGARAFRDQFHEISERFGPSPQRGIIAARFHPNMPHPDSQSPDAIGVLPKLDESLPSLVQGQEASKGAETPYGFTRKDPDEKLLEALESPKDRLFLLRLEQDVINFVKDSQEATLDLPPCNSFYRLLAHKLADYYYLTHFVDNAVSAVRLYRTPFCRLPPPLTGISNPPTSANTPPPNVPAVKIMRRGGADREKPSSDANTPGSSEDPSKTTSEAGGDSGSDPDRSGMKSSGSMSTKDKHLLTREEREAKYKEARERIFKGFEESDNAEGGTNAEDGKDVSRSSSGAGKKKPKKRNANDDGFEARSQFNAYYHPEQFPARSYAGTYGGAPFADSYIPPPESLGGQPMGMGATIPSGPQYPKPFTMDGPSSYPMASHGSMSSQGAPPSSQGPFQMPQAGYGQPSQPKPQAIPFQAWSPEAQRSAAVPPVGRGGFPAQARPQTQPPQQQWTQPYYPNSYPAPFPAQGARSPADSQNFSPVNSRGPYPYGQLPQPSFNSSSSSSPYQSQHPIPGSYNRQTFNPQTQSFIPGSGYGMNQAERYGSQPPADINPQYTGQFAAQQMPAHVPHQAMTQGGPAPFSPGQFPQGPSIRQSASTQNMPYASHQPSPNQLSNHSTISKWGTPSHLPPKPPPPQMSPFVENKRPLPPQAYGSIPSISKSTPQSGPQPYMMQSIP
ncbi:MAG: hypothetical protein M1819_001996 [Sarea resinae]|nr:MAG: hypothetical protein M1819_001996 [Sarea resinae]